MTILKSLAAASLLLLLVPAGQAFASVPKDVGHFQTKCMAQGGTFGALGHDAYDCGYRDGTAEICIFGAATPDCEIIDGATPRHSDQANLGGPGGPGVPNTGNGNGMNLTYGPLVINVPTPQCIHPGPCGNGNGNNQSYIPHTGP